MVIATRNYSFLLNVLESVFQITSVTTVVVGALITAGHELLRRK
jgi:hypothetical protein